MATIKANPRRYLEHYTQVGLIQWVRANQQRHPELQLLFSIPNGGKRPTKVSRRGQRYSPEAVRLKAEGVEPGIPDLFLSVARNGYHGLYLETKTPDGTLSPTQRIKFELLKAQGYAVEVYRNSEEGINIIRQYLNI